MKIWGIKSSNVKMIVTNVFLAPGNRGKHQSQVHMSLRWQDRGKVVCLMTAILDLCKLGIKKLSNVGILLSVYSLPLKRWG